MQGQPSKVFAQSQRGEKSAVVLSTLKSGRSEAEQSTKAGEENICTLQTCVEELSSMLVVYSMSQFVIVVLMKVARAFYL